MAKKTSTPIDRMGTDTIIMKRGQLLTADVTLARWLLMLTNFTMGVTSFFRFSHTNWCIAAQYEAAMRIVLHPVVIGAVFIIMGLIEVVRLIAPSIKYTERTLVTYYAVMSGLWWYITAALFIVGGFSFIAVASELALASLSTWLMIRVGVVYGGD